MPAPAAFIPPPPIHHPESYYKIIPFTLYPNFFMNDIFYLPDESGFRNRVFFVLRQNQSNTLQFLFSMIRINAAWELFCFFLWYLSSHSAFELLIARRPFISHNRFILFQSEEENMFWFTATNKLIKMKHEVIFELTISDYNFKCWTVGASYDSIKWRIPLTWNANNSLMLM